MAHKIKVLITGASGLVGGRLVQYLKKKKIKITATSRKKIIQTRFKYSKINWESSSSLKKLCKNKNIIINCAGYDLNKSISAGQYAELVENKINVILKKLRNPIICGGAGLYFRALTRGIFRDSFSDLDITDFLGVFIS